MSNRTTKCTDNRQWLIAGVILSLLPISFYIYTLSIGLVPSFFSDFWEHSATITEIIRNPLDPTPPMRTRLNFRNLSPYHFSLGVVALMTNVDSVEILQFAGALNILVFLFSLWLFAKLLPTSHWQAYTYLLLCVLSLWGTGALYSGEYLLRLLPVVASYPSFFAFSLSIATLALWPRCIQNTDLKLSLLVFALVSLILATHQLCFAYFLIPSIILFSWYFKRIKRGGGLLACITVGGLLLFCVWPFVPVSELIQLAYKQLSVYDIVSSSDYSLEVQKYLKIDPFAHYPIERFYTRKVLFEFGPAFLAVICIPFIAERRTRVLLLLLVIVPGSFWLLSAVVPWPPFGWRFSPFMVFWLQISAAWFLCRHPISAKISQKTPISRLNIRRIGASLCLAFLTAQIALAIQFPSGEREFSMNDLRNDIERLEQIVDRSQIIVGPRETGWVLPTFGIPTPVYFPESRWEPSEKASFDTNLLEDKGISKNEKCAALERLNTSHFVYRTPKWRSMSAESILAHSSYEILYKGKALTITKFSGCSHGAPKDTH